MLEGSLRRVNYLGAIFMSFLYLNFIHNKSESENYRTAWAGTREWAPELWIQTRLLQGLINTLRVPPIILP